jgi:hypothetical protein
MNFPTAEQSIKCVILCQYLTDTYSPINMVRFDVRTGVIFILAGIGDNIEVEIYRNGLWRFV